MIQGFVGVCLRPSGRPHTFHVGNLCLVNTLSKCHVTLDRKLSACLCVDERSRVGAGWSLSGDVNEQVESHVPVVDYQMARQREKNIQF